MGKRLIVGLLVIGALAAPAVLPRAAHAGARPNYTLDTDPVRLGDKAFAKDQLQVARTLYEEAVASGYRLPEAYLGLARIAEREGRYGDAETQYRQAAATGGDHLAEARGGLGVLLLRLGRPDEARAEFTQALQIDEHQWAAQYGLARLDLAAGNLAQARGELAYGERRRGLAEGEDLYHHGLALLWLAEGNLADAETEALRAMHLDPAAAEHGELVARIYQQRGIPALAIQAYEQALTAPGMRPTAPLLHQLGNLYRQEQRYNDAHDRYVQAVALDSSYAPVFGDLADLLRRAGRHELAARSYLRYLEAAGNDTSAWLGLAGSLYELRRFDESFAAAARARQLDPASGEARFAAARAGIRSADPATAAQAAELITAAPAGGWDSETLLALATWQMGRKELADAAATLARAAAADSTQYQIPFQQGIVALKAGQPQLAVGFFQRAVLLAPESAATHLNLGLAYYQAGQIAEATAALKTAVERDSGSTVARRMLGQVLAATGYGRLRAADYAGAVDAYGQATEADPDNADGWAGLGSAHLGGGKLDAAETAFARARAIDPKNVMLVKGTELLNQARNARKESESR